MIRRVATLCLALLVLLYGPLAAAAQDGTPVAGGQTGPAVGTPVSWIGNEGTELAQVTITAITDPFPDYDPSSPPDRGFHYVLVAVTVDNTGTQPVSVDPNAFFLVDTDGFIARARTVYRPAEATAANPDLQYGDLAPGAGVSGVVGFLIINGVEVERAYFRPDSNRLITLVDQGTESVPLGTAVSVLGTEGTEVGQVTVNQLIDPFQDYDPGAPPERGSHFVVAEITVANTGSRPLQVYPNDFSLVDTQGFLASPAYLYRTDATNPPDFQGAEIAPGASLSGIIGYQVLNGTEVTEVLYSSETADQLIVVGQPAAGGSAPTQPTRTAPQPTPSTVAPPDEPTTTAGDSADCTGLKEWFNPTFVRLVGLQTLVNPTIAALSDNNAASLDPARLREIAVQIGTLAEQQASSTPPPAGQAINEALANTFQRFSDAFNALADAIEANDTAAQSAAATELAATVATLDTGGELDQLLQEFAAVCPELTTLIGG